MTQLESYLAYYLQREQPGYAVLVTGAWGVGKTFQVMKAIPQAERYYVSLFGLQSPDDVYAAVLATMFPKTEKIKRIAGNIDATGVEVSGLGSLNFGKLASGLVGALLRNEVKADRVIIFDDLERCALSIRETLGVINTYVEHHGCRVLVIAHDEKLAKEFSDAKEKIFGQTIAVEPDIASAFSSFSSAYINPKNADFIKAHEQLIVDIFISSDVKSLRVLKHTIEDLARLHAALSPAHIAHSQAMIELVSLFVASSLEVRAGRLKREDLITRTSAGLSYAVRRISRKNEGQLEEPAIVRANQRYKTVNFDSRVIGEDLLSRILVDGSFDTNAIQASINDSSFFIKPAEAPAWKVFIQFDDLQDDVVEKSRGMLQEQFINRTIESSGELLHLFSLRFMMAENKLLPESLRMVEKSCKLYVDDLLAQGRIEPLPFMSIDSESITRSFGGFTYWVTEKYSKHFSSVVTHLMAARQIALESRLSELAPSLLELMQSDGIAFFEKIAYTNNGDNTFASVPIFASIDPKEFVKSWLRTPSKHWHRIQAGLNSRYGSGLLQGSLKKEAAWIKQVRRQFENEIRKASGIRKLRLRRALPNAPQD